MAEPRAAAPSGVAASEPDVLLATKLHVPRPTGRPEAPRAGVRPAVAPAPARRAGLAWPPLPAAAVLATIGAGYAAYSLVRLHPGRPPGRVRARSRAVAGRAAAARERRALPQPSRRGRPWAWVLACTGTGLLADAGVLAACFGLAGLPVPWRGLLFAYAAGQLAGRLVPLPGGIGDREGGMLGALTLTGTPPAAAAAAIIVYRVAGCWAVGAAGTAVAATLARRSPGRPGSQRAGRPRDGSRPARTPAPAAP